RDQQLTEVIRPDGQRLDFRYDAGGRWSRLILPEGEYHYAYEPKTGHVSRITAPDGGTLSFRYDGALLMGTTWAGTVAGTVARQYNSGFNVSERVVNGLPVIFAYDPDGLLIQAGGLGLTRNADNGLLAGTTLGHLKDTL
ncbi:MAG: RHS repeat protein, partial [Gammaproteobacteria bacterium]